MKFLIILVVGKLISLLSSALNFGSGSTWPGHVALKLEKNFIKKILTKNKNLKIIVVTGTNGKTTTTSLITYIIKDLGYKVFSNPEGANLLNGIASTLIKNSNIFGKLDFDFLVLETDEFSFPHLIDQITPQAVVILNLFRDQLDRYGEVNTIGLRWFKALQNLTKETTLVINGDDPFLFFNAKKLLTKNIFFGVDEQLMKLKNIPHDVDFHYCPNCQSPLTYKGISYAHLGNYFCKNCGFKKQFININIAGKKINYPLEGLYNIYNTNAVMTLAAFFLKADLKKVNQSLSHFKPAFGRQEKIVYQERKVFILLSKNPAGFNQSLKSVSDILKNKKTNFLVVLNDRIPDGQDVSWIWDVDFENIVKKAKNIFVSGDRVYDMAIRFKYENKKVLPISNLKKAVEKAVERTDKNDILFILPTYSAMLEIRKILVGRKFL